MSSGRMWEEWQPLQKVVDVSLSECFHALTRQTPKRLAEAIGYSLLAPGKRLRPILAILACRAVGGTTEAALPAGCAVEMIHTYSLIHDDLPSMDDDDLRRGLPTCHKKFDEATAILAGDALLTLAFELLATRYPARTAAVTVAELARGAGASGMVAGQMLDLAAEGRFGESPSSLEDLEAIHRRKTGALFRSSLRLGVMAAQAERPQGVDETALKIIDQYASAFGLAFQVTDDLLDVNSSAEKTGKKVGKDAARGKLTYPGFLGVEASAKKAAVLCEEAEAAANRLGVDGEPLARLCRFLAERDR